MKTKRVARALLTGVLCVGCSPEAPQATSGGVGAAGAVGPGSEQVGAVPTAGDNADAPDAVGASAPPSGDVTSEEPAAAAPDGVPVGDSSEQGLPSSDDFVQEDPVPVAVIEDDEGEQVDPEEACGIQEFDRERKPSEVLLVLDRSGSMEKDFVGLPDNPPAVDIPKWEATVPTVVEAIESTGPEIWWGYKAFPELEDTDQCAPETIVPTIHSPIAENNATDVVEKIRATLPDGDGTPTGDAVGFGMAHLIEREAVSDNPKYLLLVTDGEPTCNPDEFDSATDYTVDRIEAALAAGYSTFVLGVDTTKENTIRNLNRMAIAGGHARPNPNPPPVPDPNADDDDDDDIDHISFFLASTPEEIATALEAIKGEIGSCVFDLDPPPPVPDNIAVDFSDARADRDPTRMNGWEYTNDDYTQLEVYGSWCDRIKTEAMNQVNIKYGCPDMPIPRAR